MSKNLYPNSIRIGLIDPSISQTWAQRILSNGTTVGSVKKGDTINHTTSQPIATGLFCQRIFGPCIDYTCACGHEKIRIGFNPNISPPVCPECSVEWTHSSVRRQFLGSIELISPVTHKWFSDSRGAYISNLLGITQKTFKHLKECKLFFTFNFEDSSLNFIGRKKIEKVLLHQNNDFNHISLKKTFSITKINRVKETFLPYFDRFETIKKQINPLTKQKKKTLNHRDTKTKVLLKHSKAINYQEKKRIWSNSRAMRTLQLLVDPQKPLAKDVFKNFQLMDKDITKDQSYVQQKPFISNSFNDDFCSAVTNEQNFRGFLILSNNFIGSYPFYVANQAESFAAQQKVSKVSAINGSTAATPLINKVEQVLTKLKHNGSKNYNFNCLVTTTKWLNFEQKLFFNEKNQNLFMSKRKYNFFATQPKTLTQETLAKGAKQNYELRLYETQLNSPLVSLKSTCQAPEQNLQLKNFSGSLAIQPYYSTSVKTSNNKERTINFIFLKRNLGRSSFLMQRALLASWPLSTRTNNLVLGSLQSEKQGLSENSFWPKVTKEQQAQIFKVKNSLKQQINYLNLKNYQSIASTEKGQGLNSLINGLVNKRSLTIETPYLKNLFLKKQNLQYILSYSEKLKAGDRFINKILEKFQRSSLWPKTKAMQSESKELALHTFIAASKSDALQLKVILRNTDLLLALYNVYITLGQGSSPQLLLNQRWGSWLVKSTKYDREQSQYAKFLQEKQLFIRNLFDKTDINKAKTLQTKGLQNVKNQLQSMLLSNKDKAQEKKQDIDRSLGLDERRSRFTQPDTSTEQVKGLQTWPLYGQRHLQNNKSLRNSDKGSSFKFNICLEPLQERVLTKIFPNLQNKIFNFSSKRSRNDCSFVLPHQNESFAQIKQGRAMLNRRSSIDTSTWSNLIKPWPSALLYLQNTHFFCLTGGQTSLIKDRAKLHANSKKSQTQNKKPKQINSYIFRDSTKLENQTFNNKRSNALFGKTFFYGNFCIKSNSEIKNFRTINRFKIGLLSNSKIGLFMVQSPLTPLLFLSKKSCLNFFRDNYFNKFLINNKSFWTKATRTTRNQNKAGSKSTFFDDTNHNRLLFLQNDVNQGGPAFFAMHEAPGSTAHRQRCINLRSLANKEKITEEMQGTWSWPSAIGKNVSKNAVSRSNGTEFFFQKNILKSKIWYLRETLNLVDFVLKSSTINLQNFSINNFYYAQYLAFRGTGLSVAALNKLENKIEFLKTKRQTSNKKKLVGKEFANFTIFTNLGLGPKTSFWLNCFRNQRLNNQNFSIKSFLPVHSSLKTTKAEPFLLFKNAINRFSHFLILKNLDPYLYYKKPLVGDAEQSFSDFRPMLVKQSQSNFAHSSSETPAAFSKLHSASDRKPGKTDEASIKKKFKFFSCSHSFPVRPSFAQPEEFRRQFFKFLETSSLNLDRLDPTAIPIVKYKYNCLKQLIFLGKYKLSEKKIKLLLSNLAKDPVPFGAQVTKATKQLEENQKSISVGSGQTTTFQPIVMHSKQHWNSKLYSKEVSAMELETTFHESKKTSMLTQRKKQIVSQNLESLALFNFGSNLTRFGANNTVQRAQFSLTKPWPLMVENETKTMTKELHNKQQLQNKKNVRLVSKTANTSDKRSAQALEVYFSEVKSLAKEQTIKKILSQTGGGGLQTYLGLINLGELIFILQNDLSEIAPRLVKSQSTRQILVKIMGSNLTRAENNLNFVKPNKTKSPKILSKKLTFSKNIKKEFKAVKKICSDFQNRKNIQKRRYKLAFQLLRTMSNPTGMTLSTVPVLPPGLRPIIDVPKIGPITADLNIRYRSLLFALRNLRELAYVDFRNAAAAQASVQEAVDDLLYTGGKTRRFSQENKNPNLYKSLAMRLKGKHGRFRGNLLGKRVDYSGRSVIVVGPTLKIHQCGLPFEIAIKLFNPFLIRSLIQKGFCQNVYKAKQLLIKSKFKPLIWSLCQEVMSEHLILLNRAPTLHRLGVQAFMPVLISGRAILLHPLVCTGFNADFDGDQMGVHVPLFPQARAEAWKLMWSRNNFLSPSSGEPILLPSQDMVLGCYYLTQASLVNTSLLSTTSNLQNSTTTTAMLPPSFVIPREGMSLLSLGAKQGTKITANLISGKIKAATRMLVNPLALQEKSFAQKKNGVALRNIKFLVKESFFSKAKASLITRKKKFEQLSLKPLFKQRANSSLSSLSAISPPYRFVLDIKNPLISMQKSFSYANRPKCFSLSEFVGIKNCSNLFNPENQKCISSNTKRARPKIMLHACLTEGLTFGQANNKWDKSREYLCFSKIKVRFSMSLLVLTLQPLLHIVEHQQNANYLIKKERANSSCYTQLNESITHYLLKTTKVNQNLNKVLKAIAKGQIDGFGYGHIVWLFKYNRGGNVTMKNNHFGISLGFKQNFFAKYLFSDQESAFWLSRGEHLFQKSSLLISLPYILTFSLDYFALKSFFSRNLVASKQEGLWPKGLSSLPRIKALDGQRLTTGLVTSGHMPQELRSIQNKLFDQKYYFCHIPSKSYSMLTTFVDQRPPKTLIASVLSSKKQDINVAKLQKVFQPQSTEDFTILTQHLFRKQELKQKQRLFLSNYVVKGQQEQNQKGQRNFFSFLQNKNFNLKILNYALMGKNQLKHKKIKRNCYNWPFVVFTMLLSKTKHHAHAYANTFLIQEKIKARRLIANKIESKIQILNFLEKGTNCLAFAKLSESLAIAKKVEQPFWLSVRNNRFCATQEALFYSRAVSAQGLVKQVLLDSCATQEAFTEPPNTSLEEKAKLRKSLVHSKKLLYNLNNQKLNMLYQKSQIKETSKGLFYNNEDIYCEARARFWSTNGTIGLAHWYYSPRFGNQNKRVFYKSNYKNQKPNKNLIKIFELKKTKRFRYLNHDIITKMGKKFSGSDLFKPLSQKLFGDLRLKRGIGTCYLNCKIQNIYSTKLFDNQLIAKTHSTYCYAQNRRMAALAKHHRPFISFSGLNPKNFEDYRSFNYNINIQSIVWINCNQTKNKQLTYGNNVEMAKRNKNKATFLTEDHGNAALEQNQKPLSWIQGINKIEGDGLPTPTLELRITPYGKTCLLHTAGSQSFAFKNSILLPMRRTVKPVVFDFYVRTTIGRLIFNTLLQEINSF